MAQRTFSIIKPDAVRKGSTAAILAEIEKAGFKIVSIKRLSISKAQAEGFYHVHAARPFFGELTEFMSSGPIFPMVLEKDNAIADFRKLMGATNPAQAEEGTIRKLFAASIGEKRDSWIGCRGYGCVRDWVLLRRDRTGLVPRSDKVALRGRRSLRDVCTASLGAPDGRNEDCADQREDHTKSKTRHEETAARVGRFYFFSEKSFRLMDSPMAL